MALDPASGQLYVVDDAPTTLRIYDTSNSSLLNELPLDSAQGMNNVVLSAGGRVYVAGPGNPALDVVDITATPPTVLPSVAAPGAAQWVAMTVQDGLQQALDALLSATDFLPSFVGKDTLVFQARVAQSHLADQAKALQTFVLRTREFVSQGAIPVLAGNRVIEAAGYALQILGAPLPQPRLHHNNSQNYQLTMNAAEAARQRRAARRQPVEARASYTLLPVSSRPTASPNPSARPHPSSPYFVNVPMRSGRHDQTITIAAPGQAIRTMGLNDCHAVFVASSPNANRHYKLIGVHLAGGAFDARLASRLLEASVSGHQSPLKFDPTPLGKSCAQPRLVEGLGTS